MQNYYLKNLFLVFFTFVSYFTFSHSVQIQYCVSCNGDLRVWVEHWHGSANPNTTTMTISLDVGGTTTTQTQSPAGSVMNLNPNQLPGCSTPIVYAAGCPGDQNTYNDWVYYDFFNLPQNVPITFTIISGNSVFTEDGCNMYPLSVTFTIQGVGQVDNQDVCNGQTSSQVNLPATATWTNDNPSIGIPASGTGPIPPFTPIGPVGTTATIDYVDGCGAGSFVYTIQPAPSPGQTTSSGGVVSSETCLGNAIDFQDNSSVPPPYIIDGWTWDFGDGTTDTTQNPSHVYTAPGTYNVTLSASSDIGCSSSTTFPVVINEIPTANFSSNTVCANTPTSLTDQSNVGGVGGSVIDTWEWDILNDNTQDYATQNPQHTFTAGGTYDVSLVVETDKGCRSPEFIDQVNVNYIPVPDFESDSVCFGDLTTLTDLSTVIGSTITAQAWNFGDATSGTGSPVTHTYPSSGDFSAQLQVTSAQGCVATVTNNVYVRALPVADFAIADSCYYNSITTTNLSTVDLGTMTYVWDFGDGTPTVTGLNPTHNYAAEGIYTVTLTATSNFGCTDNVTHSVNAYVKPVANYTAQPVCVGTQTQVNDLSFLPTTIAGDQITNWAWDINDDGSFEYSSQNPQHLFGNEGIYNTTLIASTNFGCTDTITLPIDVWPLPDVAFNFTDLCHGDVTQFNDQSSISNSYTSNLLNTFVWDFGDAANGSGQNPTHVYSNFGDYNVTLTVTSDHGCVNSLTQMVPIHPLPQPDFTSTSICVNTPPTTFTDATTIPTGSISQLDWTFSDGGSAMGPNVTHSYTNATNATNINMASLTATSNFGCVNSVTLPVVVYEKPYAEFTSDETRVCDPGLINFTDISYSDATTVDAWQWNFFNGVEANTQNPTVNYSNETDEVVYYDVELIATNSFGCNDTVLVNNYIAVVPQPIADFYPTPGLMTIQNTETEFVNQSELADEYLWDFGDGSGNTSIQENPIYEYPAVQADYVVQLIAYNYNQFCSDTAYATVIVKDIIILYVPNIFTPDNDDFNQVWNPTFTSGVYPYDFHMLVFNRYGETVWESYDPNATWDGNYGGELVADGVYVWKIEFKETMSDKRHQYEGHVTILK
jgi:gliding motility-associated-like protein